MKGYIAVEGQGDIAASANIHQPKGLTALADVVRARPDASGLLVLRDEDDACPRERGPELARVLRDLNLPFPAAVVLLHREYEVLFLACMPALAGKALGTGAAERPGILVGTNFQGDFERVRGVKEWLSDHFPEGKIYKPSLDQPALTRLIDFEMIRRSGLSCFGTLERALKFMATSTSGVYPSPRT